MQLRDSWTRRRRDPGRRPWRPAVGVLEDRTLLSFITAPVYPTGGFPTAVAAADFNGDGADDLAVVNSGNGPNSVSVLLNNGDGTFAPHQDYAVGAYPSGVAVGDFNGDGKPDLAVSNGAGVAILLGNGDGSFQTAAEYDAGFNPAGVAVGDFTGSGIQDLVVADYNPGGNTVSVLLGTGDGSFKPATSVSAGVGPIAVATGDLTGAGRADILVANYQDKTVSVLLSNGDGSFRKAQDLAAGSAPDGLTVGDFNHDGHPDLAVADFGPNGGSGALRVYLGNGDGTFQAATTYAAGYNPRVVAAGDFNNDGNLDLAVASEPGSVNVLLGNGDGSFQAAQSYGAATPFGVAVGNFTGPGSQDLAATVSSGVAVFLNQGDGSLSAARSFGTGFPSNPYALATGDFNGDGIPDLVTASNNVYYSSVSVLLGNGDGTYQAPTVYAVGLSPTSVAVADVNGDGKLDLVVTNSGSNTVSVLLGNGDGTFQAHKDFAAGSDPRSVAVADVSGDGKPDLVVADFGDFSGAGGGVSILVGNGDGSFQAPHLFAAGEHPDAVAVADVNGDGKPDVVAANFGDYYTGAGGTVSVLLGNGDGTFQAPTSFATGAGPRALAVADFNADGSPDLAVADYASGTVSVLLNNGDGTFQPAHDYATGTSPDAVAVADFNGDSVPDLAVANFGSGTVSLLLGSGTGAFRTSGTVHVGDGPSALLVDAGDNLVVTNYYWDEVSVVINTGGPPRATATLSDPRAVPRSTAADPSQVATQATATARVTTPLAATPTEQPMAPPALRPPLSSGLLEDAVFARLGLDWDSF